MTVPFEPSTPLQKAIHAADRDAVLELLRRLGPRERASLRTEVVAIAKVVMAVQIVYDNTQAAWRAHRSDGQRRALAAAALICGLAKDAAACFDTISDALEIAKEFRPPSLQGLAGELVKLSERHIGSAQRLIAEGLSQRPDTDDYIRGLMELPRVSYQGQRLDIQQCLAADPGLKDVLLRIMEIEGTPEVSLASCDKFNHPDRAWSRILRELSDAGMYPREVLLGKTLDTLERGWIQFRSGWFTNFHAVLDPTIDEMRPHATRYLALLASRIPPTVSFALDVVRQLERANLLDPRSTLEAL